MSFTFDGLSTGLQTSQIIQQLLAVEARPQTQMKSRLDLVRKADSAWGSLRTAALGLKSAATELSSSAGWEPIKVTSSNSDRVAIATTTGASSTGSVEIRVLSLLSNDTWTSTGTAADRTTTSVVAPGTTLTIGAGAGSTTVEVGGTGTLDDIVNAINGQDAVGVRASVVRKAEGQFSLQVTATEPGETLSVGFGALPGLGAFTQTSQGSLARVQVGSVPGQTFEIASTSNTIDGVLPGVTVELKQADAGTVVTISSTRDPDKVAERVKSFVDAYNLVTNEIAKQTKVDVAAKISSPLAGMSSVRQLRSELGIAYSGTSTSNPGSAGITLNRDGTLSFDKAAFAKAYSQDPAAVEALFTAGTEPGLAKRISDVVDKATNIENGYLTTARKTTQAQMENLQTSIDAFQRRLDKRESALRRQFANLERTISGLRSQSGWLSGALNSLG